ncbi:MAG: polynucleotide adenylyltransferase PcnB [Gammaproteobacteria bacterium]|nr:MAG: polynucleotide adenylyltransferase PcnB [Gammaproteobacteria bacterium]
MDGSHADRSEDGHSGDDPSGSDRTASPSIVARPDHNISRANISRNALKVLYRLREGGFQAFLVGGSVRDLLLGVTPKDFDIATDAHPEQVAELFRNCRLIGRRFRLAHVRFGREIIEVATFRAGGEEAHDDRVQDDAGRILRDNVYGSIEEDVWRRDFTCNALYYNIADFSIWDFTGGFQDVHDRVLRLIGDPETRYREDPVRMLRAIRFAAKLGFSIAPETAAPIARLAPLLAEVPPARLFDEILKLFQGGHGLRVFELLMQYGLFGQLFPHTHASLAGPHGEALEKLLRLALANTDARVAEDKPVTPTFLLAVLLWGPIRERAALLLEEGGSDADALAGGTTEVVLEQLDRVTIPRRFSGPLREMLALQPRFSQRRGVRAMRLLEHKRFRAAYDFLALRAECGEVDPDLVEWWTAVQEMDSETRRKEMGLRRSSGKSSDGQRPRSRRRSRPD